MAIKKDTLDQLLLGRDPKEVFSKDGLFDELKKALAERVLNAELDDHLIGEEAAGKANHRNGYSKKTVLTETSKINIKIPRDREGTFDPKLIQRYQGRFPGFDEKIVSMYARGMTVREIKATSSIFMAWRSRPISSRRSPTRFWRQSPNGRTARSRRCIRWFFSTPCASKSATRGWSVTRPSMSRSASLRMGTKDILGLWIETSEGAKFWLRVMNELRNRGVGDVLIAVVDGLKGFPEAINAVFPETIVQTCIVHLIRNSMDFASWKDRKAIAAALKTVYRAKDGGF